MSFSARRSPLRIIIFILLKYGMIQQSLAMEEASLSRLIVAASHTALHGDLEVFILKLPGKHTSITPWLGLETTTEKLIDIIKKQRNDEDETLDENNEKSSPSTEDYHPFVLRIMRLDGFSSELVGEIMVEASVIETGNVSLTVPCGFFTRGGAYSLRLQRSSTSPNSKFTEFNDFQMTTTLDVRWPIPSLSLELQHFNTYPDQPVLATLEYTGISCLPAEGLSVDTFSLQLIYCGASVISCDPRNKSHVQMLYSEEITGFPTRKILNLRCEFFGLAGHYALRLKPTDENSTAPTSSAYIKVEISNQYVFNVHARSVYPCDGNSGGLSVLFEYPSCRLQGDRVRVYGRLRADVASLAPPSSLHYVAELKAPPGKHTLTFDCELFTEKFVEYCFVYVSQAINNAMAEVRADCIPTFPIKENDAGGWGEWSSWSSCSSTCVGGVRNRYRFCDNPPPRYGAKFCQGKAVETESCGGSSVLYFDSNLTRTDWECNHGTQLVVERPEVTAEIGKKCRCGCHVKLHHINEKRVLAASTQACPGRSFWLIQGESKYAIRLHFDQTQFPCSGQYVRARDGDSLSAQLLADISFNKNLLESDTIISTDESLLLEFFSDETTVAKASCIGGFLAQVSLFLKPQKVNGTAAAVDTIAVLIDSKVIAAAGRWIIWLSPVHLVAALLLLLMFTISIFLALQYAIRYRKYQVAEDLDSLTDSSTRSSGSMSGLVRRARAISSTTLISEVVSLVRLSRRRSSGHGKLEETSVIGSMEDDYQTDPDFHTKRGENAIVMNSNVQKEESNGDEKIHSKTIVSILHSTSRRNSCTSNAITVDQREIKYARPVKLQTVGPKSPLDTEDVSISEDTHGCSTTSGGSVSVTNVSVPSKKSSTFKFKGFSPASTSSNVSTLRCGKETKDRRNRERLLQGPGSEFSLTNPDTDLELDYYDYNVINAGAAPGSYLGMDPAFLVWIPPLVPGECEIIESSIENEHYYEEISEKVQNLDNTEGVCGGGVSLSPSEYEAMKNNFEDKYSSLVVADGIKAKKLDFGGSKLHDEIITEYRARLNEGVLPIHRILEESRVRISHESLLHQPYDSSNYPIDVIPNRLRDSDQNDHNEQQQQIVDNHYDNEIERPKSAMITTPQNNRRCIDDKKTPAEIRNRLQKYADNASNESNSYTNISSISTAEKLKIHQSKKRSLRLDKLRDSGHYSNELRHDDDDAAAEYILGEKPKTPSFQRKSKDINRKGNPENIPLKDFCKDKKQSISPVKVHNVLVLESKDLYMSQKNQVQSPDYGLEADIKETTNSDSFYDLIGENEHQFKFADDDDDEAGDNQDDYNDNNHGYIDNKIVV